MAGYGNNGAIAPINANLHNDAQVEMTRGGYNTNYYDTSKIAGANETVRYQQNYDPGSFSFLSKTSFQTAGLNPFQNNFSEQILKYQDDGTVLTGNTIIIA